MPSVLRLWLRLSWKGVIGWALGSGLMVVAVLAAFRAAVPTPAEAARFALTLEPFARTFQVLLGEAQALDTAGGFLTWRALGVLPVILSIYGILLATRMTLGEERRGATDLVLSTSLSRGSLVAGQGAALAAGSLGIGVGGMVVGWLGAKALGMDMSAGPALAAGLNVGLVMLFWACLAGFVAQLSGSRGFAGALTGTLMVMAFLGTNLASSSRTFEVLSWFSPFTAYRASRPLVPGEGVAVWALVAMGVGATAVGLAAALVFRRRDLNKSGARGLPGLRRGLDASRVLRGPFTRDVWALKGTGVAWGLALSGFLSLFVVIEDTLRGPLEEFLKNVGFLGDVFGKDLLGDQLIGVLMFGAFMGPILSVFAVLQVSRWAAELGEGLFVPALSTAVSRARLLLSRVGAGLAVLVAALAVTWGSVALVALMRGVDVPGVDLGRGMGAALTVALVFLSVGLAVGSWWRASWAAPVAGALLAASFVFDIVSQAIELPAWSTSLSVFARLGNPVREPLAWGRHGVLLLVGLVLVGLAVAGFARKDLAE